MLGHPQGGQAISDHSALSLLNRWAPVVIWAAIVLWLSSERFSGENTQYLLLPVLRTLLPGAPEDQLLSIHSHLRKLAHVVEYAILGVLVARAMDSDEGRPAARLGLAVLLCDGNGLLRRERHRLSTLPRTPLAPR
jgi:VanZ family protein